MCTTAPADGEQKDGQESDEQCRESNPQQHTMALRMSMMMVVTAAVMMMVVTAMLGVLSKPCFRSHALL